MSSSWNWCHSGSGKENQNFGGKLQPTAIRDTVALNNSSGVLQPEDHNSPTETAGWTTPHWPIQRGGGEEERQIERSTWDKFHLATSGQIPNDT